MPSGGTPSRCNVRLKALTARDEQQQNVPMILPWPKTIKEYVTAILAGVIKFTESSLVCEGCGHKETWIRWGYYKRKVIDVHQVYEIAVQRFRCLICGKTVSALPSFVGRRERFSRGLLGTIVRLMIEKMSGPYSIVGDPMSLL